MKRILFISLIAAACPLFLTAQITTPVKRANFGVDADLRSSFFNGLVDAGNDDWFRFPGSDTLGKFMIDTTGAASILAAYLSDASPWPKRMSSFYRTMNYPSFSIVNNRLLMDALFVRDYHGTDTTTFAAGSNKNGMSPVNWTGVVQNIPDKNDILDTYVHIRRAGPNKTDSLWMFGALSLDNTTGNRYFDFEMYQTDIYYDRASQKFYGYGPDAGHTSWQFDSAGNVTVPGDIIFSASYQSSVLTSIEARIWVNQSALSITPAQFSWSGQFDGAFSGATYGYASILPKNGGTFYTGMGSAGSPNKSWAGAFQVVLQDNSLATEYIKDQFMEFSVNLTKLGLDPVATIAGDICGTPFRRILIKTRASASFTAELKDFVAPTDLFLAPRVDAAPNIPVFCSDTAISDISVMNPSPTSVYLWTTTDGNILTSPASGPIIRVDKAGTYIVTQYLQSGCSPYAADTITVLRDTTCAILESSLLDFQGKMYDGKAKLSWRVTDNQAIKYFDLERSFDGIHFYTVARISNSTPEVQEMNYYFEDLLGGLQAKSFYYRLGLIGIKGSSKYSKVIRLSADDKLVRGITITPNPVTNSAQINVTTEAVSGIQVHIYSMSGKETYSGNFPAADGNNVITITDFSRWQRGVYLVMVNAGTESYFRKMILLK